MNKKSFTLSELYKNASFFKHLKLKIGKVYKTFIQKYKHGY
jgi:hypothetical protein